MEWRPYWNPLYNLSSLETWPPHWWISITFRPGKCLLLGTRKAFRVCPGLTRMRRLELICCLIWSDWMGLSQPSWSLGLMRMWRQFSLGWGAGTRNRAGPAYAPRPGPPVLMPPLLHNGPGSYKQRLWNSCVLWPGVTAEHLSHCQAAWKPGLWFMATSARRKKPQTF